MDIISADLSVLMPYAVGRERKFIGPQMEFQFPNGWGASVITGIGPGRYELAVTKYSPTNKKESWPLHYANPVAAGDVCHGDGAQITAWLLEIFRWSADGFSTEGS
jgi:hypothetical protein